MPITLNLEISQILPSDRVKSTVFHPNKAQVFASTNLGHVLVWDTKNGALLHTLNLCPEDVSITDEAERAKHRAARALAVVSRQNWLVCGTDKGEIHVLDLDTLEEVHKFKGHDDYVRCLVVHPSQPFVISSGDDKSIKIWDWSADWECERDLSGHEHYVMSVAVNPESTNQIVSASLDKTIKVWNISAEKGSELQATLQGHDKGINSVAFVPGNGSDSNMLVASGSDDQTIKLWDSQSGACLSTHPAHKHNVSCVVMHPTLPVLFSASEDGKVKVWSEGVTPVDELDLDQGRVWAIAFDFPSMKFSVGCDRGLVLAEYK